MTARRRIIPLFIPHYGCPHQCVFCNQRRISGQGRPATADTVREAIARLGDVLSDGAPTELAFYGGSFTAIPVSEQEELLRAAQAFLHMGEGNSLRISTRPDCVDSRTAERLLSYGVETVELGAQSMCAQVLLQSKRGHTAQNTCDAAGLVRNAGLRLIIQMMTGLPGDTPERSAETAERVIALRPDGVRIYPAVVIRDTELCDMYRRGEYREHSVEDAVSLCAEIAPKFTAAGIPVIRLGLNPSDGLSGGDAVAGAYHPAFGELVYSRIYYNRARRLLSGVPSGSAVTIAAPPGELSKLIGQKRSNIQALRREFGEVSVKSADVSPGEIVILRIESGR